MIDEIKIALIGFVDRTKISCYEKILFVVCNVCFFVTFFWV